MAVHAVVDVNPSVPKFMKQNVSIFGDELTSDGNKKNGCGLIIDGRSAAAELGSNAI